MTFKEARGVDYLYACDPQFARACTGLSDLERVKRAIAWFKQRHRAVPSALRRAARVLEHVPERARPGLAAALTVLHPELGGLGLTSGPILPAYPNAPVAIAARVAMGKKPVDLYPGLTAKEAHEALLAGVSTPITYLMRMESLLLADVCVVRHAAAVDITVARWILACLRDPARREALVREQRVRGPHGEIARGFFIDRVDEILPEDLPRGAATGVQAAFASAAERAWASWQKEMATQNQPLRAPPAWWRPIRCARLLSTAAELAREGREMDHCAAGYASYVRSGRSVVVAIAVPQKKRRAREACDAEGRLRQEGAQGATEGFGLVRSTVELDAKAGRVLQHQGVRNSAPPVICERALRVCLRRWGLGQAQDSVPVVEAVPAAVPRRRRRRRV